VTVLVGHYQSFQLEYFAHDSRTRSFSIEEEWVAPPAREYCITSSTGANIGPGILNTFIKNIKRLPRAQAPRFLWSLGAPLIPHPHCTILQYIILATADHMHHASKVPSVQVPPCSGRRTEDCLKSKDARESVLFAVTPWVAPAIAN